MKKDIYEIVLKKIRGEELDTKESVMLESFLCIEENYRLFESLKRVHSKSKGLDTLPEMDIDRAFAKYKNLSGESGGEGKILSICTFMRYAAAIVIMFSIATLGYYLVNNFMMPGMNKDEVAEFVPGSKKAELVLADGRVVSLEAKKDSININYATKIKNTGKQLIYDKAGEKPAGELSYNSLVIPRGGEYQLKLADGTKVWINSESKLRYPVHFGADKRVVYLEGEAYFDVEKDKKKPFIVKTQGVDVKVLGTSFNVCSYSDEKEIQTTLVEGKVEVMNTKVKKERVILEPGYQARFKKNGAILTSQKVDVNLYTSWKDERFVFENIRLEDLLKRLARWYDVEIFYMNNEVKDIRFSGGIKRYDKLDKLLYMFERTHYVDFRMKGRTLTVTKKYKK